MSLNYECRWILFIKNIGFNESKWIKEVSCENANGIILESSPWEIFSFQCAFLHSICLRHADIALLARSRESMIMLKTSSLLWKHWPLLPSTTEKERTLLKNYRIMYIPRLFPGPESHRLITSKSLMQKEMFIFFWRTLYRDVARQ